jgi:hypothetical protein
MKTTLAALLALALCSCTTTTTTSILPDGTRVVIVARSSDPVAIQSALDAAEIIIPVVEMLAAEQKDNKAKPIADK